jgi:putative FmdB family regulatory protein
VASVCFELSRDGSSFAESENWRKHSCRAAQIGAETPYNQRLSARKISSAASRDAIKAIAARPGSRPQDYEFTMPIYEYACPDCGHQDEHMQKLADAPLSTCPSCGKANYVKKISAAGFALKGSGWYVTDFRNGSGSPKKSGDKADTKDTSTTIADAATPKSDGAIASKADGASTPASPPAPAPAPTSAPAPAAG